MDFLKDRHIFCILVVICSTLWSIEAQNDGGMPPISNKWDSVFKGKTDDVTSEFESCVRVCTNENPEAKELCKVNCKTSQKVETKAEKEDSSESMTSPVSQTLDYMFNRVASLYNWIASFFNSPSKQEGGVKSDEGKLVGGEKEVKEETEVKEEKEEEEVKEEKEVKDVKEEKEVKDVKEEKEVKDVKEEKEVKDVKGVKEEGALSADKGLNIRIWRLGGGEKEEEESQTVVHRLIIIKHIPFFSLLNDPKQNNPNVGDVQVRKYVSWFGEEKCAWRRSILFFFLSLLCVTSTWYCIAKLLSYRNRLVQDSRLTSDDLEYLIPTDEKVIFMNHSKLAMIDEVTPPPPYKPTQSVDA